MRLSVTIAKPRNGGDDSGKFGTVYARTPEENKADGIKRREKALEKREQKRMQPY